MVEWLLVHGSLIAFFILANSFFVAAEFALVSARETRIEQFIALNRPGARTALRLKHNIDEFLPAVQFGVTLASLALGGIGEHALADLVTDELGRIPHFSSHVTLYSHAISVVVAFAVITYFEVLLGELVPKSLALQRAERLALAVAGPMEVFIRITRPAVKVMNFSATQVLRVFRAPLRGESAAHSPEELKLMATATRRMGLLPPFQEEMIHRAIELNNVTASEIMTPRGKIFSLPADMLLEQASAKIVEEQHSRVPVYDAARGREAIIGVVYSKDVSRLMHFRGVARPVASMRREAAVASGDVNLRQVMREVLVVPETKPALELLEEFQERRRQIAIVVDEFGSTLGMVTMEDVLEQIVGEMEDEFDTSRTLQVAASGGGLMVEGSASLRDLATQLGWKLPREAGVETLAGFLLEKLGHIPKVGERVDFGGRCFAVMEMDGMRIARVRVDTATPKLKPKAAQSPANVA
ncbi:Hemolysin, contains CBS domains [Bryocella elongata]|uniref:Hemolysin, contains CBS domains n=1 Tax=Bryocella elongata TaxID=863522 RepID=A0A1H5ZRF1_9BACT|nr:hemolysin family protein [Bryocella elongata]SEG38335.1 Hemolysin, contains CBS domains [Bryocella elongata]